MTKLALAALAALAITMAAIVLAAGSLFSFDADRYEFEDHVVTFGDSWWSLSADCTGANRSAAIGFLAEASGRSPHDELMAGDRVTRCVGVAK